MNLVHQSVASTAPGPGPADPPCLSGHACPAGRPPATLCHKLTSSPCIEAQPCLSASTQHNAGSICLPQVSVPTTCAGCISGALILPPEDACFATCTFLFVLLCISSPWGPLEILRFDLSGFLLVPLGYRLVLCILPQVIYPQDFCLFLWATGYSLSGSRSAPESPRLRPCLSTSSLLGLPDSAYCYPSLYTC